MKSVLNDIYNGIHSLLVEVGSALEQTPLANVTQEVQQSICNRYQNVSKWELDVSDSHPASEAGGTG